MNKALMCRLAWTLTLVACGRADDVGLAASLSFAAGLSAEDVRSVDIFLLDGKTTNDETLDCAALGTQLVVTREDVTVLLHRHQPLQNVKLPGLQPGTRLVLAINGYPTEDGTGNYNAYGCKDGIQIEAGRSVPVVINLAGVP